MFYLDISVMLVFAYLLYIFIEYPFVNILDILKRNEKKDKLQSNHNNKIGIDTQRLSTDVELNFVFNE